MLTRKVICCISVLALMLILGWRLEQSVVFPAPGKQTGVFPSGESLLHSYNFADPIPVSIPFQSREYVRIRLKAE
ncbi:hypothetical protein C2I18_03870 [Paenibacillus sp. PK3_47]|nr:hypothetical protein C2I18_03870 [Paenibacillus sp. PK3_47]